MIKFVLLFAFVVSGVLSSQAQQERKFIREGNGLFEKQDFEKAEVEYRKAADKKNESFEAAFNIGDALYKQKKFDEALQHFSALAKQQTDRQRLGEIYHNIGNTLLSMNKIEESIEAYKESLRNRPDSEQTKYNLEFARQKLQQNDSQQNQDKNGEQDKQEQDRQNQDKQNQDKQNQDKQNQDKEQDGDKKEQEQGKEQQEQDRSGQDQREQMDGRSQEGRISKEDGERLLNALQNDEKEVQEKVQKQKALEQKAKRMKIDKNW